MRKKYIIIAAVLILPVFSFACDICGCGAGNSYIGILPDFNRKIFGLRYRVNSLVTHLGVDGASTYLTTREKYKTLEVWGGYNIGKKMRIMVNVPYGFNERFNQGATQSKNGLGDVSVLGFFQAINHRKTVFASKLLIQSLWIGGGVKLPTGRYSHMDKPGNDNTNLFQLGTGSTDFTFNTMYDIRLQDAGFNLAANYRMNTANKHDYIYGRKLNINSQAYYKFRILEKITLAPNSGIQYEIAQRDSDRRFDVEVSGGKLLLGTAGIETTYKKISIGGNYQTPLSQHLGAGFVKAKNRFMTHVSIAL